MSNSVLGMDLLLDLADNFLEDVDTICNVSRTLSVLSSEEDIDRVTYENFLHKYMINDLKTLPTKIGRHHLLKTFFSFSSEY